MNDLIISNCVSVTFPSILNCKSELLFNVCVYKTFISVGSEKLKLDGDEVDDTFRGVVVVANGVVVVVANGVVVVVANGVVVVVANGVVVVVVNS